MDAETILRNACDATIDKRQSAPQPYGSIVVKLWHEETEALLATDHLLELVARLLAAAHSNQSQSES